MVYWWYVVQKLKPFNYGRDTGMWNRAKVIGVIDTFAAIAETFGEKFAMELMMAIPAETILDQLNSDKTADKITLREE